MSHNEDAMNLILRLGCFGLLIGALGGCGQADVSDAPNGGPTATSSNQGKPGTGAAIPSILLVPAFPKLTFDRPVFVTSPGQGTNEMFVVQQTGQILMFENRQDVTQSDVKTFLDLASKIRMRHNEEGLLSLVFHPKYKENGQFFVYYTVDNPKRNRISRFLVSKDDPSKADADSEQIILEVEQPWANHNGSTLLFGPDGFLYASFGDGGAANDPQLNGQNLSTLLATIIRIDVDRPPPPGENGKAYAIPADNPFVGREGALPEIWAYGLRNVWRMSFDRQTGDLWAGDVGQDAWEEIDLIVKGGNYGWNLREGKHDFADGVRRMAGKSPPTADPMIDPVVDYPHREGISVTGGYVYRGTQQRRLQGVYIYADYGSRRIWGLRYENGAMSAHRELLSGPQSTYVSSFGEDANGELYACGFDRYDGRKGKIYRVIEN
jgi:glucose/arabinose dehydrogenase